MSALEHGREGWDNLTDEIEVEDTLRAWARQRAHRPGVTATPLERPRARLAARSAARRAARAARAELALPGHVQRWSDPERSRRDLRAFRLGLSAVLLAGVLGPLAALAVVLGPSLGLGGDSGPVPSPGPVAAPTPSEVTSEATPLEYTAVGLRCLAAMESFPTGNWTDSTDCRSLSSAEQTHLLEVLDARDGS